MVADLLVHFSAEPLTAVHSVEQEEPHFKPRGLWVSVEGNGDGWRDWCEGESFNLHCLAHETEILLKPDARILRLQSAADIDALTDRFHVRPPGLFLSSRLWIDWTVIASAHQGIIIAPYIWERRLDPGAEWYYAWDCASGCIWDADAVAAVSPRNAKNPASS
jgi:hypothetical protein